MERSGPLTLARRVEEIERWQQSVAPMLSQLHEDQSYRARWRAERMSARARWKRFATWSIGVVGGVVVTTAALVQLVHLL